MDEWQSGPRWLLKLEKYARYKYNRNFAAMEWNATNVTNFDGNDSNGTWIDVNGSLKLRYVIEFDLPETQSVQVNLKGFRKFLVVPARWMDETEEFISTHEQGFTGEPITQAAMNLVSRSMKLSTQIPLMQ